MHNHHSRQITRNIRPRVARSGIAVLFCLSIAACSQNDGRAALRGAGVGAAAGAVTSVIVGGAVSTGIVVGAAAGATASLFSRPLRRILR